MSHVYWGTVTIHLILCIKSTEQTSEDGAKCVVTPSTLNKCDFHNPCQSLDHHTTTHTPLLDVRAGTKVVSHPVRLRCSVGHSQETYQTARKAQDGTDDARNAVFLRHIVVPCGAHRHDCTTSQSGQAGVHMGRVRCAALTFILVLLTDRRVHVRSGEKRL